MIDRNGSAVVAFAPGSKGNVPDSGDPLEKSGQEIVGLIKEAAESSRAICEQATSSAEKLLHQLHAAEDKIKELNLDVRHYCDRAIRAEKWLARIRGEIEGRFFQPHSAPRSGQGTR
jgi:hypothetical protein